MSEMAILTVGLSKSFGALAAVSELSLKIQPGAVYGFLGRNGAGKTTTMRMLLGLVRPTKGSARVLGLDPTKEPELMRILERVGFVPQRKQLYGWATPAELARMNKAYFPRWSDDAALAKRLEIPMKTAFKKLSIGNQSRVALLLARAQGAEILILDEPTAGLDPVMWTRFSACWSKTTSARGGRFLCRVTISAKWNRFATGWGSWKGAGCYSSRVWRRYGRSFGW
jgi:ABC-2 type transport system ATP-binding protein